MRITATEKRIKENLNYSKIDRECVNLCKAINEIPGICTVESCCGHGESVYQIFFFVTSLTNLSLLLSCIHYKYDWAVYVNAVYFGGGVTFYLEGPIGDFETAERIAREIRREKMAVQREEEERRKARRAKKSKGGTST